MRRNSAAAAADKGGVGLVAGRLFNDVELQTPPPLTPGQGGGGELAGEKEEGDSDGRVMDEIRRQRKKEQEELDILSPALILIRTALT